MCFLVFLLSKCEGFMMCTYIFVYRVLGPGESICDLLYFSILIFAGFDLFPCSFVTGFCSLLDVLDYLRVFWRYVIRFRVFL